MGSKGTTASVNRIIACYIESRCDNTFFCLICISDVSSETWQKHVSSTRHIATLEQFNLIFQECCNKIYCKICDDYFFWNELQDHAETHILLPWYKPNDLYKTFMSNCIVKYKMKFLCCLCYSMFSEWFSAYVHLNDTRHIELKGKQYKNVDNLLDGIPSGITHETIVSEGLVAVQTGILKCKICKNTSVQSCNVDRHIKGILHKLKSSVNTNASNEQMHDNQIDDLEINEICNCSEIDGPMSTSKLTIEADTSYRTHRDIESNESTTDLEIDFIYTKFGVSRCIICNINIDSSSAKDHTKSADHITAQKEYGCSNIIFIKNTEYYCKCCCCLLSGVESVYNHLMGKRHSSCLATKTKEDAVKVKKSPELTLKQIDDIIKTAGKVPPRDYFLKRTGPGSLCTICCKALCDETSIHHHLQDKQHLDALTKYGCDNILLLSNDDYYCIICNKIITGIQNVLIHLKEVDHKGAVRKTEKIQIEESHVSKDISIDSKSDCLSECCDFIVRTNPTNVYCSLCECSFSSCEEADNHISGDIHKNSLEKFGCDNIVLKYGNSRTYVCKCCRCTINSIENATEHAKGKKHQHYRYQASISYEKIPEKLKEQEVRKKEKAASKKLLKSPGEAEMNKKLSPMTNDLSKLAKRLERTHMITMERPRRNRGNRFVQCCTDNHVAGENADCHFCNISLPTNEALHGHMAHHVSSELSNIRNGKTATNYNNNLSPVPTFPMVDTSDDSIGIKNMNNNYKDALLLTSVASVKSTNAEINSNTPTLESSGPTINLDKVLRELDLDIKCIYDLTDKSRIVKLGMMLSFPVDKETIYCLVCNAKVPNELQKQKYQMNCRNHLYGLRHSRYLEEMEADHAALQMDQNQFSELNLAYEYMEAVSENLVRCYVCEKLIEDDYEALRDHVKEDVHKMRSSIIRTRSTKDFVNNVQPKIVCDWYNVFMWWCVPCEENFNSEINFQDHLRSQLHKDFIQNEENDGKKCIYDFCPPCGLLWYGYRCTYAYHFNIPSHKWLLQDGYYMSRLPEFAKGLLETSERLIEDTVKDLDRIAAIEQETELVVMRDIERAVIEKYPKAKAYMFGSRASHVSSPKSDIDVFLDCGNIWGVKEQKKKIISKLVTDVNELLSNDTMTWNVVEHKTNDRLPIIKTHHRSTGFFCNISFNNSIGVETTKLIKSFINAFPLCRKLIIFLKQWLISCNLTGSQSLTNYALYWCIIFLLQKESILPSVATLIKMKNESRKIHGWEVGVSHNFKSKKTDEELGFKDLLKRFFKFYGNFDFRYDVVCPLLGNEVKKRDLVISQNLPEPMAPYLKYLKNSTNAEPFRMDSVMCLQDPYNLQDNLTKDVSKIYLTRFRTCCQKSFDVLTNL